MKPYFFIIILLLLFTFLMGYIRKRVSIRKVRSLSESDRNILLNDLLAPFGFCYVPEQDILSSRLDAWQRDYGYTSLYDTTAVHFHMVFDKLPVYFNYQNKTWLLELWKGQYGIATGCEIGLYYADHILSLQEYSTASFTSVSNSDMIGLSFMLCKDEIPIAKLHKKHWWLTAFHPGLFSHPSQLSALVTLTFPNPEMANAYADGLLATNIKIQEAYLHFNIVGFLFADSPPVSGYLRRFRIRLAQLNNRFWCFAYQYLTRPFTLTSDKILYLYFRLPFIFRKVLRIRSPKKVKHPK